MINLLNITTILFSCLLVSFSIYNIYKNQFSILHIVNVAFFFAQVIPMIVIPFFDWSAIQRITPYMYNAMIDDNTSIIYNIFVILSMVILSIFGNRYSSKNYNLLSNVNQILKNIRYKQIICFVTSITMFSTIFGFLLAPDKHVYLQYAYFYRNNISYMSSVYIFHKSVMNFCKYLSFTSIIGYYLFRNKSIGNMRVGFAIFLLAWIDGKRTIFSFCLLAIILIDFLEKKNKKKVIKKAFLFIILIIAYFILYSLITGKNTNENYFNVYFNYFSRLGQVKTAIYSRIYNSKIVNYSGQSLVYNLTFFIPRSFWCNKPYGFYRYFTSYAFYGIPNNFIEINLQVNMFSEFIANFGVIGYFLLFIIILFITKESEKTNSIMTYATGLIFLTLYTLFGFEGVVSITFLIWLFFVVKDKLKLTGRRI